MIAVRRATFFLNLYRKAAMYGLLTIMVAAALQAGEKAEPSSKEVESFLSVFEGSWQGQAAKSYLESDLMAFGFNARPTVRCKGRLTLEMQPHIIGPFYSQKNSQPCGFYRRSE